MLIFRVPDSIADEIGKLVVGKQSDEKDNLPWSRGIGSASAGANVDVQSDKVVLEVQPDVDHNYKNPTAPDRFVVNVQGKSYPGKLIINAVFIYEAVPYSCNVLVKCTAVPCSNAHCSCFLHIALTAMLLNLPAPVEAQRMFERHNVLKSGDIGQVLQLFNSIEDLEQAQAHVKSPHTSPNMNDQDRQFSATLSSGITSATANITKKRYELTRRELQTPSFHAVASLNEEVANTIRSLQAQKIDISLALANPEAAAADIQILITQEEEIVDYADWMADDGNPDGIKIVIRRKMEQQDLAGASVAGTFAGVAGVENEGSTNFHLIQKYPDIVLGAVTKAGTSNSDAKGSASGEPEPGPAPA